jgi:hypothetical protein
MKAQTNTVERPGAEQQRLAEAREQKIPWKKRGRLAGFSDDKQQLCFPLALWNGKDPILKERLLG